MAHKRKKKAATGAESMLPAGNVAVGLAGPPLSDPHPELLLEDRRTDAEQLRQDVLHGMHGIGSRSGQIDGLVGPLVVGDVSDEFSAISIKDGVERFDKAISLQAQSVQVCNELLAQFDDQLSRLPNDDQADTPVLPPLNAAQAVFLRRESHPQHRAPAKLPSLPPGQIHARAERRPTRPVPPRTPDRSRKRKEPKLPTGGTLAKTQSSRGPTVDVPSAPYNSTDALLSAGQDSEISNVLGEWHRRSDSLLPNEGTPLAEGCATDHLLLHNPAHAQNPTLGKLPSQLSTDQRDQIRVLEGLVRAPIELRNVGRTPGISHSDPPSARLASRLQYPASSATCSFGHDGTGEAASLTSGEYHSHALAAEGGTNIFSSSSDDPSSSTDDAPSVSALGPRLPHPDAGGIPCEMPCPDPNKDHAHTMPRAPSVSPLSNAGIGMRQTSGLTGCFCREPAGDEELVTCESPQCRHSWFHASCAVADPSDPTWRCESCIYGV